MDFQLTALHHHEEMMKLLEKHNQNVTETEMKLLTIAAPFVPEPNTARGVTEEEACEPSILYSLEDDEELEE